MGEEENILPKDIPQEQTLSEPVAPVEPVESSDQLITLNSELITPDMETHAHELHKAPGHGWKHYFFEFFMLFLAVFCGFLAENFREHVVEKERGEELAKSFYQELKNDSVTAVIKSQNRIKQETALLYLVKYFKDSSLDNVSKTFALNFQYGINFRTPAIFEPRMILLEQLKNSGSLRYFKNDELQSLVGDLTVAIQNIYDRQDLESKVRIEYINPMIIRHQDFDFYAKMTDDGQLRFDSAAVKYENSPDTIPFRFNGLDKFDRQTSINTLQYFCRNNLRSTRQVQFQKYIEVNAQLLKLLRSEYHIE